jgi:hypothetical protein
MKRQMNPRLQLETFPLSLLCGILVLFAATPRAPAEPTPAAIAAFDRYVSTLEARLTRQHASATTFLMLAPSQRPGELVIEDLTPNPAPATPGAMLHHWRGSAFIAGATAAQFEQLLRDFNHYPQRFAPQVLTARILTQSGDHLTTTMRVRQKHVLTVVMDTTYDVQFAQLDPHDRFSTSRSTRIYEIDAPGTPHEHPLSPADEHGFLWRLNTYWSYAERDGGLLIQIETVSLSRSIPTGLGWAIGPFVQSVPRESLEFTLRSATNTLKTLNSKTPNS